MYMQLLAAYVCREAVGYSSSPSLTFASYKYRKVQDERLRTRHIVRFSRQVIVGHTTRWQKWSRRSHAVWTTEAEPRGKQWVDYSHELKTRPRWQETWGVSVWVEEQTLERIILLKPCRGAAHEAKWIVTRYILRLFVNTSIDICRYIIIKALNSIDNII